MKQRMAHILTILVDNEFGVITRITAQIRREGWNIKSLAVSESTDDSAISRITLALECFDATLPTVVHRLSRLACVRTVTAYDPEHYVCRELTLVHINCQDQANLNKLLEAYGATVLNRKEDDVVCQLIGEPQRLDDFISRLRELGTMTIARTGAVTMEKATM